MRTLYLDAFSGISGDMFLGALLDLGLDFDQLKAELAKLHVHGYELTRERLAKSSIYGTSFDVQVEGGKDHGFVEHSHDHHHAETTPEHHHEHDHVHEDHHHADADHHDHDHGDHHHHHGAARHLTDILQLIDASDLSEQVKAHAKAIFSEIAQAEATVHNMPLADVHFHEVGALDSIVDIVGCCVALELMDIDEILSSPLTDGSGFINVAHGQMPVPVPAVMQMRVGSRIPIQQRLDIHTELITPTGMGIVKTLVKDFGPLPENATPLKVGYGFGKRDTGGFNALRAVLFEKKN
ncbi:LarC family nickel insertion protein [Lactiplantibacillus garii]|uniref:LarC family nickel insertion protein n=1 Tax=Lactiplantibacillus garii TaxID=2306423 RepID=A0A3R8KFN6_9LACO|nr:LarC family nickel insertion protein [Lactiplantibacillus garii]RRK10938.1 LarC family nickel insertion protein [Lactiplantibacillus garii]